MTIYYKRIIQLYTIHAKREIAEKDGALSRKRIPHMWVNRVNCGQKKITDVTIVSVSWSDIPTVRRENDSEYIPTFAVRVWRTDT